MLENASASPRVSIIIVNWNGREHLATCLASLKAQTFTDFELILVDNGSTDDSVAFTKENHVWVRLVELPENKGFATGNNIGLAEASGEYIVTLNNDTRADAGWLAELVKVADDNPLAGMVGCRTCSFDDQDIIDTLGGRVCLDGMSRGAYRLARFSSLKMDRIEEILYPSACAALYKKAMIDEIGFFDEDFTSYCEDTDLGLRARLAGWQALLATEALVYHKYSQTSGFFSPFKIYLVERNHYWVALKNYPFFLLLLVPFFTCVRYLEQARVIFSAQGAGKEFRASRSRYALVKAILKGSCGALAGIRRMQGKRADIMKKKRISQYKMTQLLLRYRLTFKELLDNFS